MAHDVFVSYASEDKATADAVVEALEQRNIRCWVAPRDVAAGRDYAGALVQAIDASRVLVLVFSSNANASPHVMREISRAADRGNSILPLRIEDVPFSKTMEYYISTTHWLDALTSPLDQHLDQLVQSVAALLDLELEPLPEAAPSEDEAELDTAPPAARDEPAAESETVQTPATRRSEPAQAPVPTTPPTATQGGSGPPPAQRLLALARDWGRRPAVLLAAGAVAIAVVGVAIALVLLSGGDGDSQPLVAAQPSASPRPASTARLDSPGGSGFDSTALSGRWNISGGGYTVLSFSREFESGDGRASLYTYEDFGMEDVRTAAGEITVLSDGSAELEGTADRLIFACFDVGVAGKLNFTEDDFVGEVWCAHDPSVAGDLSGVRVR